MQVEVVMPKMGESIQEGKILRWMKKPGDTIEKDESILEISTDKVDSEIPSPSAGILTKVVVPEGETVDVGTVIAFIETDPESAKVDTSTSSADGRRKEPEQESVAEAPVQRQTEGASSRQRNGDRFYSPLVKTIAQKEGIALEELDQISGSGMGGRVTKNDILGYLTSRSSRPAVSLRTDYTIHSADLK